MTIKRKALVVSAVMLLVAFAGCRVANDVTWSAQSMSSDHNWLAAAHTEHTNHGFGGESQWTAVEMKQNISGAKSVEVLKFDESPDSVRDLKMNWQSPNHLDITYHGDPPITFQAVKAFGKDVTVERLP
jgi:hypothetical protein